MKEHCMNPMPRAAWYREIREQELLREIWNAEFRYPLLKFW